MRLFFLRTEKDRLSAREFNPRNKAWERYWAIRGFSSQPLISYSRGTPCCEALHLATISTP